METLKCSLWFVPNQEDPAFSKLTEVVKDLSNRFQSPEFVPHITLIPDVVATREEVIEKTKEICQAGKAFDVVFNMFDFTDGLFQTLVLRAEMNEKLRDINKVARDIFNRHGDSMYVPHISLIYKTGLDNETKKAIIQELANDLVGISFKVDKVHIYTSVPEIENWELVDVIDFKL